MEMLRVYLFFAQACQFISIYEVKISCWFLKTGFSLNQPERAAVSDWLELSHSSWKPESDSSNKYYLPAADVPEQS